MREYLSDQLPEGAEEAPPVALPAIKFTLDGEEFRCVTQMDADALLEWSELGRDAADGAPITSPDYAAFFSRFLRAVFGADEYQRLRRHIRANGTRPEVLLAIIGDLQLEMAGVVEDATARPTAPPPPSSPGDAAPAAQRARVISLAQGTVEFADAPPAGQRPGGKRAAGSKGQRAGRSAS
jgi:hypothetical protein